MKRCMKCVLPDTFPGITFNSKGQCSVCSKFEEQKKFIPSEEILKNKLDHVIQEAKNNDTVYHAVVGYSGGKDSTYLIYMLQKVYGLKILAVTFDNGFMSEHSFKNMRTVLETLNVDHLIVKPRMDLMKKIFNASSIKDIYPEHLTKFGSGICISCIRMVTNTITRIAVEKKIPMVMLGNSPGQLIQSESEIMFKDNKIPFELRKRLFKPLAEEVGDDIYYYFMLDKEVYRSDLFPVTVNAFPLIGYSEDKIYETIKSIGWVKPTDVDPNSTNCMLNSLGIRKHKDVYDFHPYDYEMSMLVRLGIIKREEALARIEDVNKVVDGIADIMEKRIGNE